METCQVAAAGRTHTGLRRENNEDSFHLGESLIVVADGVGGAVAGEVASSAVVEIFAAARRPGGGDDVYEVLTDAVQRSTDRINELVRDDPELDGMGTTVTAMMWVPDRIVIAQVGDSRAYYLPSRGTRELVQITRDDSFVQYLVDTGAITAEQAAWHPRRNMILKALNGMAVEPSFITMAPIPGDRYLLCSDGLSDYVPREDLQRALLDSQADRDAAADALIELALRAGAPDNVTAVVADVVA